MEKYRYWVDKWWSCRYNLAIQSCNRCLFENLCLFEKNQEGLDNNQKQNAKTK